MACSKTHLFFKQVVERVRLFNIQCFLQTHYSIKINKDISIQLQARIRANQQSSSYYFNQFYIQKKNTKTDNIIKPTIRSISRCLMSLDPHSHNLLATLCNYTTFLYQSFSLIVFIIICVIICLHLLSKMMRPKPLKLGPNSTVLLVGGCMGIGRQMAILIAKTYRSRILLVDVRRDLFEEVSQQISQNGGICECFYADLANPKSVNTFIKDLQEAHSTIDFLLYNAGILMPSSAWDCFQTSFHTVLNVNFVSMTKIVNSFLENVEKSQGKHIAVVASVASIIPGAKNLSSYFSTKHAIFAYMNSLRLDLKYSRRPITVSIGCPYAINTTMMEGFSSKMDFFLPVMTPQYVADRLVREFMQKKQICFVRRRIAFLSKFMMFLPTFIVDFMTLYLDTANFKTLSSSRKKD